MRHASTALRRLDHVFAAVDHGSLRQAAKVLRVRESSVSRNIAALEQFLDMQLFERDVRGVRLTKAGQAWVGIVRAHYEALQEALADGDRHRQEAGKLRIGLCALVGRAFLMRLIDRFRKLHPSVALAIEDVPREQCLPAIRRRRLDIVFTHELDTFTFCRSEIFGQERLFVLLPPGDALAQRQVVTWADLAHMRLLVPASPAGPLLDPHLLERLAVDGGPEVQMCGASQATVILEVLLGHGVALADESFARAVTIDAAQWKPLAGQNSISSIRAAWLESNPKRALLWLVGTARNLAEQSAEPEPMRIQQSGRNS